MDRREFLAMGGLAAAKPALGLPGAATTTGNAAPMFQRVDFGSDGIAYSTVEYATLLHTAATNRGLEADYYSLGGAITELEQKFAGLIGKEAAMFVPTGTLANHLAIRKLAGSDRRVLVQAESHLYNDSGDCAETLSGLNLVPIAVGRSTIELAEVRHWVERSAAGRVGMKVGAISIESPVRRRDHERVDFDELARVCGFAREQGIRLHLDGARMFSLPLHSGKSVREYAALFDTVYVSLWKHFSGTSGAILAGDAAFIDGLFNMRRMFGGSLPHAWPQIALVAEYADRYEADYAKSWQAAEKLIALLEAHGRFRIRKVPSGTSRFFLSAPGVDSAALIERAARRGVDLPKGPPGTEALPMQVNPSILRMQPAALARIFIDSLQE